MTNIKLGITGGIGSGKSYVCKLLEEEFHIPVYYTDREAKRLNQEDPEIRNGLKQLVGEDVYTPDGQLNRKKLADYLFASAQHAETINRLIHPHVRKDFQRWCHLQHAPVVAMECAILFESGFHTLVDHTLLVTAPSAIRIKRVCERDHTHEDNVRQRMAHQLPENEKAARSNFVIHNDGISPLIPQLQLILSEFKFF